MNPVRRISASAVILLCTISFGTLGYHLIEGWAFFDSLYMTIITLATVGFREVHDMSQEGQAFTILLIVFGAGGIAYAMGSLIQFTVEGQLRDIWGRKKVAKQISELKTHYIVCGYGRIGQLVCQELKRHGLAFVVIEQSPDLCQEMVDQEILCINGDATDDDTLLTAGILTAKGLITITTSDTTNLYITLSARGLNPNLFILARSADPGSELKLKRAGADQVVSPYTMGAQRIAQAVLRPSVVDFLELAAAHENLELQIEEIPILPGSILVGRDLPTTGIRDLGVMIVSVRKQDGTQIFNPPSSTVLNEGDIMITVGEYPGTQTLLAVASGATHA